MLNTEKRRQWRREYFIKHKHPCVDCGKLVCDVSTRCLSCQAKKSPNLKGFLSKGTAGAKNPTWKGGRLNESGYIAVWISSDDFFFRMSKRTSTTKYGGYILEHRLVMAKHLNRCLLPWEIVHHKNGIRDDNRLENLELLPSKKYHIVDSYIKARLNRLETRVTLLEAENVLLKSELEYYKQGSLAKSVMQRSL